MQQRRLPKPMPKLGPLKFGALKFSSSFWIWQRTVQPKAKHSFRHLHLPNLSVKRAGYCYGRRDVKVFKAAEQRATDLANKLSQTQLDASTTDLIPAVWPKQSSPTSASRSTQIDIHRARLAWESLQSNRSAMPSAIVIDAWLKLIEQPLAITFETLDFVQPNHTTYAWVTQKALRHLCSELTGSDEQKISVLIERLRSADQQDLAARAARLGLQQLAVGKISSLSSTHIPCPPADQWLLNAVKNDLMSLRGDGRFGMIAKRLQKASVWVKRTDTVGKQRWSSMLGRFCMPFRRKSPFWACRFGLPGITSSSRDEQLEKYNQAMHATLQTFTALIPATSKAGTHKGELLQFNIRHALKQALDKFDPLSKDKRPPSEDALLVSWIADDGDRITKRLTPNKLASWAKKSLPAEHLPTIMAHIEGLQKLHRGYQVTDHDADSWRPRFWVRRYYRQQHRHHAGMNAIYQGFCQVIDRMDNSFKVKLVNGGEAGCQTKGLSGSISSLLSGFMLRGRLNLGWSTGRQAVFEVSMNEYDMSIIIGRQRQRRCQVGVGAAVGPAVHLGAVRASATAGVEAQLWGREDTSIEDAICLRLPRESGKTDMKSLKSRFKSLLQMVMDPELQLSDVERLQKILDIFPDISINQIGRYQDQRRRRGVMVEASARAGVIGSHVKAGVVVGLGVDHQHRIRRHYADASGAIQVERDFLGQQCRVQAYARGGLLPEWSHGSGTHITAAVAEGVTAQLDLAVAGCEHRFEMVKQYGRFHATTNYVVEHQSFAGFEQAVMAEAQAWCHAAEDKRSETKTSLQDTKAHTASLQRYLKQVQANLDSRQTFAMRYEIRPEVLARLQTLCDEQQALAMQVSLQKGDQAAMESAYARLQSAIDTLVRDRANYRSSYLRVLQRGEAGSRHGVSMLVHQHALSSVEGLFAVSTHRVR